MKLYKIIQRFAPFFAFILGIWYFCIRILGYNLEYIPGDLGDSRFINYLLEHGYRWIMGKDPSFWDAGFMYPFKNTIALSDSMLGTVPIYSVWRIFGFSPETSYQLWWICICALNYWISYIIFKKWFKRAEIAFILAWIFAFTIFNLGQLNYMQMIIRFMVPVVFYAAFKMINSPSLKYLSIYFFGIIFQFYCAMYTGFYLMYFSLFFLLIYYLISKKWKDLLYYFKKEKIAFTSIIFILSFLAMLWLFLPYLKMSKLIGTLPYSEVLPNVPYLKSFLFPPDASFTWRFLFNITRPDVPVWWLHFVFTGIIPFIPIVLCPIYLLFNWYKKIETPLLLKSIIITSIVIILFHIRTKSGISLYSLFFRFPGMSTIRVLMRFMNVEIFILLLLSGYILARFKTKYILLFFFVVFADNLFSLENISKQEKVGLIKRKEVLLNEISQYDFKKYKAVAFINSNQEPYKTNIDIMLVTQSIGIKTINGYSSFCPGELGEFAGKNTEIGLNNWLENQKISKDEILLLKK